MKRREWKLAPAAHLAKGRLMAYEMTDTYLFGAPPIHVREVLPGEITITRDALQAALNKGYPMRIREFTGSQRELVEAFFGDVEDELFGPRAPEGTQDT